MRSCQCCSCNHLVCGGQPWSQLRYEKLPTGCSNRSHTFMSVCDSLLQAAGIWGGKPQGRNRCLGQASQLRLRLLWEVAGVCFIQQQIAKPVRTGQSAQCRSPESLCSIQCQVLPGQTSRVAAGI